MIIAIIGPGTSGKTLLMNILKGEFYCKSIPSYTTNPQKAGNTDYRYIGEDTIFDLWRSEFFVEIGEQNGYQYGCAKTDVLMAAKEDSLYVIGLTAKCAKIMQNYLTEQEADDRFVLVFLDAPLNARTSWFIHTKDDLTADELKEFADRAAEDEEEYTGIKDRSAADMIFDNGGKLQDLYDIAEQVIERFSVKDNINEREGAL